MSLKARGSLGSTLVYTGVRKTHVVKRQNYKSNPNTIPQRSHRSMLQFLAAVWTLLIPPAHASWVTSAPITEHSPYHWFMKWNLERWKRGLGPAWWFGSEDSGATPTLTSWSLTNQGAYVRLGWPASGASGIFSAVYHRSCTTGFTPSPSTAIHVDWFANYRDTVISDRLPRAGTYYYRLQAFSANGVPFLHVGQNEITIG